MKTITKVSGRIQTQTKTRGSKRNTYQVIFSEPKPKLNLCFESISVWSLVLIKYPGLRENYIKCTYKILNRLLIEYIIFKNSFAQYNMTLYYNIISENLLFERADQNVVSFYFIWRSKQAAGEVKSLSKSSDQNLIPFSYSSTQTLIYSLYDSF